MREFTGTVTLSEREEKFTFAVMEGLPMYKAAPAAGYSEAHGYFLIKQPHIIAALKLMVENGERFLRQHAERKPYRGEHPEAPPDEGEAA